MNEFEKIQRDPHSRRAFLARMGAAGLGMAAVSMLQGCGGGSSSGNNSNFSRFPISVPGKNDNIRILNYALTLEILEADLYRQALNLATGRALSAALEANSSAYTPDAGVSNLGAFNAAGFAYLRDFAYVEAVHRDFLTATVASLGDTPVVRNPKGYVLLNGITKVAPTKDLRSILSAILPLEETGVRAYLGASPFFVDFSSAQTKMLIQAAVGIYSTEARHSAAIQYILGNDIGPNAREAGVPESIPLNGLAYSDQGLGDTFEYLATPDQVIRAVSAFFVK